MKLKDLALAGLLAFGLAAPSRAATWTDWTSGSGLTTLGTLSIDGTDVDVTVTGTVAPAFRQLSGGIYYYTGSNFNLDGAGIPTSDLIGLNAPGTFTVSFSQAVSDIYFALVSWNVQPVTFSAPVEVLSVGCGFWGCGTASVSGSTVSFTGEPHGLLKLGGTFTSFSFTTASYESWHGFTLGAESLPAVPLPATGLLLAGALGAIAAARRRRRA
ncbi:MAG: VPLPA-CTERM sorting domain-containing protein [Sphingomonadales bacterium]|nr:VPLPA-CTERM sorting domain-containing protein [Sphingomonadales bacterium]